MTAEISRAEIFRLKLLSPLFYVPLEKPEPFDNPEETGGRERLFCFEPGDALGFEPDPGQFPGKLIFGGEAAAEAQAGEPLLELPGGTYLFAQKREISGREGIIELAVEMQQEALWQRLKPGDRFYLRYLFEDGSFVTQLFRPYS